MYLRSGRVLLDTVAAAPSAAPPVPFVKNSEKKFVTKEKPGEKQRAQNHEHFPAVTPPNGFFSDAAPQMRHYNKQQQQKKNVSGSRSLVGAPAEIDLALARFAQIQGKKKFS